MKTHEIFDCVGIDCRGKKIPTWSPEKAVLASLSESFVDSFSVAFCGISAVDRFSPADWLDKLSTLPELSWIVEEDTL